jgi:hypothetical protein
MKRFAMAVLVGILALSSLLYVEREPFNADQLDEKEPFHADQLDEKEPFHA